MLEFFTAVPVQQQQQYNLQVQQQASTAPAQAVHPVTTPSSAPLPFPPPCQPLQIRAEGEPGSAIILAEDKKYYPTAEETYGAETETLLMEEDAQPLEVPIIAPVVSKKLEKQLDTPLATHYSTEYLATLSSNPELIRNVAVSPRWRGGGLVCNSTACARTTAQSAGQYCAECLALAHCVAEQATQRRAGSSMPWFSDGLRSPGRACEFVFW